PSNADFPGSADSVHGMAELIFGHVLRHAGMSGWPVRLANPQSCNTGPLPTLRISGRLRGDDSAVALESPDATPLELAYDPQLVGNPEPLIASLAHGLGAVLVASVNEPLPGGRDNWPYVAEVAAVAMGFGVMQANSAKITVRSCASCGPKGDRTSFLPELDLTYALAIFCVLKGIAASAVTRHLKPHLRGAFKRSMKDAARRLQAGGTVARLSA
ncbi:MAG: hypothetical protein ACPGU7_04740, partial [Gammaproteobacteria bacterium]